MDEAEEEDETCRVTRNDAITHEANMRDDCPLLLLLFVK
jgi:hypothetical protein